LYKPALEILRSKIRESTSSMTSVPKPLKFLRNQYDPLKIVYEKITDKTTKVKQTTSNDILKFYYSDYFQYYKGILRRRFVSSWYDDKREA
jgi:26S proteasome regulatory subunit N1